ncbi:caspase family protein [Actinomadura spongiicola]|uniref:caspase family protein n=1 Tax=Actinomadura spongiicola TaxID=2303421 RepID=UPI0013147AB1|nr:caspase family protein [Actinomadura spongiicola]
MPAESRREDAPATGLVYALLVGIDAYRPPVPPLAGCGNDSAAAAIFLRTLLGDRLRLVTLRDAAATTGGVRGAFRDHLGLAGPGDVALFWFSGHGSQAPVPEQYWHLEPTGMHQTLVCADSRHEADDLTDKELSVLLDTVAERGAHVAVVLDCCHSGGGTRDPRARVRGVPPAETALTGAEYAAAWLRETGTGEAPAEHVALSACRPFETAKELPIGGRVGGAFSQSLLAALRSLGPRASYRALHMAARTLVENRVGGQTPVLYPVLPDGIADEPFLGGAVDPAPVFTLGRVKGRWRVDAGACHGIPEGEVVLAVADSDLEAAGRRLAVTEVRPGDCDVRPVGWTPRPDRRYPVLVAERPVPFVAAEVGGRPDDDRAAVEAVRAALAARNGLVRLIEPDEPTAGLRLRVAAPVLDGHPVLSIVRSDGSPAAAPVAGHGPASVRLVAAQVEHIARWIMIKDARGPASPMDDLVRVEVVLAAAHQPLAPRTGGALPPNNAGEIELSYTRTPDGWRAPEVFIRIHNASDRRLWCTLLDLTDRYRCHSALFPGDFIGARQTAVAVEGRRVAVSLPADRPTEPGAAVRDWCKLIVSDTEINTLPFNLPALDEAGTYRSDLRGLLVSGLRDMVPPLRDELRKGWWTTSVTPIVTRVPAREVPRTGTS